MTHIVIEKLLQFIKTIYYHRFSETFFVSSFINVLILLHCNWKYINKAKVKSVVGGWGLSYLLWCKARFPIIYCYLVTVNLGARRSIALNQSLSWNLSEKSSI